MNDLRDLSLQKKEKSNKNPNMLIMSIPWNNEIWQRKITFTYFRGNLQVFKRLQRFRLSMFVTTLKYCCDGFGHFDHQHKFSFYINAVTNIQMMSPSS